MNISGSLLPSFVAVVLCHGAIAKVDRAIVQPVTVDVIDDIIWPFAVMNCKDDAVDAIPVTVDCDFAIASCGNVARLSACEARVPSFARSGADEMRFGALPPHKPP